MKEKKIFLSIVIPSYNRPEELYNCLQALSLSDYPRDWFEVIVVNDGSSTSLNRVVSPFTDRINVTLINQRNAGPAAARNAGAALSKDEYLVFTDDDCMPEKDWLKKISGRFESVPNCALGGHTVNALPDNPYAVSGQLINDYLNTYHNKKPNYAHFVTSNNMALPTRQFHAVGGFDNTFSHPGGEDRDLNERLKYRGCRIVYAPEVRVNHAHRLTLTSFWRQHFNYGRGAYQFRLKCYQRWRRPVRLEPFLFYLNLLLYPFFRSVRQYNLVLSILFIVSQFAVLTGYLNGFMKQDRVK